MTSRRSNSRATLSTRIDKDLLERVRTCVRDGAGKPTYYTMGAWISDALEAHLAASERKQSSEQTGRISRRISSNHQP